MFNLASPGTRDSFRAMFFWLKKFVSFWLMPLPFCLTLLVAGSVLLRTKRAKLGQRLMVAGTVLLLLLSNKLVSRWLTLPLEFRYAAIPELSPDQPLPPALAACRYIVVLGGGNADTPGLSATAKLSESALGRITEAVRLARALPEAKLVFSGPKSGPNPSHAVALGRAAQALGVQPERFTYIDQARDTEDEAYATKKIVGDAPIALVTSAWHMPRAMALFRHAGVNALACPADFKGKYNVDFRWSDCDWDIGSLDRSTVAVRERLGYLWIWLRGKT